MSEFISFMTLVGEYGATKAEYARVRHSGKYELHKEAKLERKAQALFDEICDRACKRFPGGKDFDKNNSIKTSQV